MRVVFFGTPEFSVPSLEALLGEGFDVVAVVTQPDKPQGRSRSTAVPPPVKTAAEAEDVPVLQPARPSDPDLVERLRGLAPDVGVVVAYGHILKPELLALPRRGMINLHPSLLPELRGAAPVEWAILNGLTQTGVTIMQMDAGLDSGPILLQIPHDIDPEVTGGELSGRPVAAWRGRRDKERSGSRRSDPRARRAWPPRSGSAAAARRRASASGEGTPGPATAARRHRRADRPPAGPGSSSAATRGRRLRRSRLPRARSRAIRPGALRACRPPVRLSARPPVRE